MAVAIALCSPVAGYAAGVARVNFAVGDVTALGADGRTRPLAKGARVEVGDTINTGHGRAQLRFEDGAYMSLQPETSFKVDEFRFRENGGGADSIVMSLLKGGMRTITGAIGRANKRNYRLRTAVATIGIRGTEYSARYTDSLEVFCAGGSISVENQGGTLLLGAGQGGFVLSVRQEPQRTEARPFLPPASGGGTQEAAEEEIAGPVNPVQESLGVTPPVFLTGSFIGNWAASQRGFIIAWGDVNDAITLDANGALQSFTPAIPSHPEVQGTATIGSASAISSGNDGFIAWGRWTGGVTGGNVFPFSPRDLTQDAMHYVVGLPVTGMPTTGVATYSMLGATPPSSSGFLSGAALLDSTIKVDFLSVAASYDFRMSLASQSGTTILRTQDGGIPISFQASGVLSGGASLAAGLRTEGSPLGSANLLLQGFLAGPGAARAGMAYDLAVTSLTGVPGHLNGAVAHKLTSIAPSP